MIPRNGFFLMVNYGRSLCDSMKMADSKIKVEVGMLKKCRSLART